jgi:Ser/Thr protein kinase RdoA (MazF antagonist)
MEIMNSSILNTYQIDAAKCTVEPLSGGLINKTWKVVNDGRQYILQKVNDKIFQDPRAVAKNVRLLDSYLKENYPGYLFVAPLKNSRNDDLVGDSTNGYFRLFPLIEKSQTIDVVTSPDQAYEAAFQFGKFTHLLSGFDASQLTITIPDFHNLGLRYLQFEHALIYGNVKRIAACKAMIRLVKQHRDIVLQYDKITTNEAVRHRVTHHDTKISNVLFNQEGKGMCVIDLDTVMPGYFISDVGDMMRTYLSPVNEEEEDVSKIEVREDYFKAIVNGYLQNMHHDMTDDERNLILYSGLFMIYMQAIRFLSDYLNDDLYYGAKYEHHNFVRANNQLVLLKKFLDKEGLFRDIIFQELNRKTFSGINFPS